MVGQRAGRLNQRRPIHVRGNPRRPWRRFSRVARIRSPDLRALSRHLLERPRREGGLPDGVRRRAHASGFPRRADPGGIWRFRSAAARGRGNPGGNQWFRLRRQPGTRPDVHHGHAVAARQLGAKTKVPARDRRRADPPAGVRGYRTDHRFGHHATEDARGAGRQFISGHPARRCGRRAPCIRT